VATDASAPRSLRTRRSDLVAETLSDETLVIDTASGVFFSLRGVASALWALLDTGTSRDELDTAVRDRFGEVEGVHRDVASFVAALEADGLVEDATGVATDPTTSTPIWPDAYEAPMVKRYDDMADLLLVDPIHDVAADQGWPNEERGSS
jgi:hypothetical protein